MIADIHPSWRNILDEESGKPYFATLMTFIENAYSSSVVFPPRQKIFEAFNRTPFDDVKVVILGQDPYHEPGQAQGLSFYVPENVKPPPSLRNIAKELGKMPDLLSWADQGVLLLNATLTVEAHKAGSHQKKGWETFTDAAIKALAERRQNLVFILWGAYAQKKGEFIDRSRHLVIESAHPSPLSARRGFFGSRPFERANEYLAQNSLRTIEW
ncbi:MAG: uracil-DNA glycosylase [Kiritimatiellae bacterium]|jgi:uracil-DNA glycosylase|nr:uracil-DNA glycosylase [Kiritimatiellia bacterium]